MAVDPHKFFADPDLAVFFNADSDSAAFFNADPDLALKTLKKITYLIKSLL